MYMKMLVTFEMWTWGQIENVSWTNKMSGDKMWEKSVVHV